MQKHKWKVLRNFVFLATIAGLLAVAPMANAETIWFQDGYETDTLGADPAIQAGDIGDGYIVTEPQAGYVNIWDDTTAVINGATGVVTGSDGQYVSVNRTGSSTSTQDNHFEAQMVSGGSPDLITAGETLLVEFDMWKPTGSNGFMLIGYNGDTAVANRMFQMNLYPNGNKILVYDGASRTYYLPDAKTYPRDTWTSVKIDIDPATDSFSLSFDNDPDLTLTGLPCAYATTMSALYVSGFNTSHTGGNNNIYLDNLTITAIPEPTTLVMLVLGAIALMGFRRAR